MSLLLLFAPFCSPSSHSHSPLSTYSPILPSPYSLFLFLSVTLPIPLFFFFFFICRILGAGFALIRIFVRCRGSKTPFSPFASALFALTPRLLAAVQLLPHDPFSWHIAFLHSLPVRLVHFPPIFGITVISSLRWRLSSTPSDPGLSRHMLHGRRGSGPFVMTWAAGGEGASRRRALGSGSRRGQRPACPAVP